VKWRYNPQRRRLNVFGSDFLLDLARLLSLIERGLIPKNLDVVIYRSSKVNLIIAGRNLQLWMTGKRSFGGSIFNGDKS
jgi:hypothetical protein